MLLKKLIETRKEITVWQGQFKLTSTKESLARATALVFVVLVFSVVNAPLQRLKSKSRLTPRGQEEGRLYNAPLMRAISFGQLPVVVDSLFIKALLDPSLNLETPENTHPPFFYDLNVIVDLDPRDSQFYFFGVVLLTVIYKDFSGAHQLLARGEHFLTEELPHYPEAFKARFWYNPWRIYLLQAYLNWFRFNDVKAAVQSFVNGTHYEGYPAYFDNIKKQSETVKGTFDVGFHLITALKKLATSDAIREEWEKKEQFLQVQLEVVSLQHLLRQFLRGEDINFATWGERPTVERAKVWDRFLVWAGPRLSDPQGSAALKKGQDRWGGQWALDDAGDVRTTTPYEKLFGLDKIDWEALPPESGP